MKTGIMVIDAMTKKPITVSPETDLKTCAELMEQNNISSILVKDNGQLVGIITEQDLVRRVIAKGVSPSKKSVNEFMSKRVSTVDPSVDIFEALMVMKDRDVKNLPVKEGNKLIGMLTLKDVLKIQPSLFDLWVEKLRIKEEETKPIFRQNQKDGICEACGEYYTRLFDIDGSLLCPVCKKEQG